MNWEAIGAIGEIVGALAVFGTLAYLAVQIKQVKSDLHLSSYREANRIFNDVTGSVVNSPELAKTLEQASSELDRIEPWQWRVLESYFINWLNAFELTYAQMESGAFIVPRQSLLNLLRTFLVKEPWTEECWPRVKNYWPPSIQKLVESELANIDRKSSTSVLGRLA
jgi:hypothetical protein